MKKLLIVLALCCVLVTISCSNTDRTCDMDTIQFDTESGRFLSDGNNNDNTQNLQVLNKALLYASPLENNLSNGDGFEIFRESYNNFISGYSKLIMKAYPNTNCSDILFSFAVGYSVSESIANDIDTFDAKSRKDLTNYSGIGFSEYVLIHSFWVTFHYLNGNNTKTAIPFEGNKLRTGLNVRPGIIQIAKASLKMVEIIANEGKNTPGYRLLYFEDDRLFKNTITFLEDGGLSSQISRKLCYNRFLEVGLVNQFVCQNILKKENKNILLGDIFTTTNNYFYNASSVLGKAKSGQLLNSMQDLFWNRIVGGEINIDFYNDWSIKRR